MSETSIKVGEHLLAYLPEPVERFLEQHLPEELGWLVNMLTHVHLDTLITAWISMLAVIILAMVVTSNLNRVPNRAQLVAEKLFLFMDNLSVSQMGEKGKKHTPIIASLFLFILAGNLLGQVPLKLFHLPAGEFASPTNDLNTTFALAILVLLYYISAGITEKGFGYFSHYFQPIWFMAPFNLLEDFTRPLSLAMRLFGNILAGEVIIAILIIFLIKFVYFIPLTGVALLVIVVFELFVALIQAFIFAILSASYIAAATSTDHH